MSMMQILEQIDKLMNKLEAKYYSRLLSNLCSILYAEKYLDENTVENRINNLGCPSEEKAIMRLFKDNPGIRPGVLASVYSRVIVANFKVHYSV